jgi:hypothetical protein
MRLASAGNLLIRAMLLLEERGFAVSVVRTAQLERYYSLSASVPSWL